MAVAGQSQRKGHTMAVVYLLQAEGTTRGKIGRSG
jgi:hypothetical protein